MADILIRGMEKPESCDKCKLCALIPVGMYGLQRKCMPLNRNAQITVRRKDCPLHELPEHGEWIEDRMDYKCSACCKTVKDEIIYMLEPYQFPAFCPYCGVKLETPKEETE